MMRKAIIILILSAMTLTSGCVTSDEGNSTVQKEKIVSVKNVSTVSYPQNLYYFGYVQPKQTKALSLKVGGILKEVFVLEGEKISIGDPLVSLNDYELDLAVNNSNEVVNAAKLDYDKAVEAEKFYKDQYNNVLTLYKADAVSKQQLDEITLKYETQQKETKQALNMYNQANIQYSANNSQKSDALLTADIEGYVVEILKKPGELVGAGYPVIIVRGEDQIIKVGVTSDDVKKIALGDSVNIFVGDKNYTGKIDAINYMPDTSTGTYEVNVELVNEANLLLGEQSDVYFNLGDIEGIWLDINVISNDGEDYVNTVENSRVHRKNISLHEVYQEKVRVEGLTEGDTVIVEGGENLKEGYMVTIEGGSNE